VASKLIGWRLTLCRSLQCPLHDRSRIIHVSRHQTGKLIGQDVDNPHYSARTFTLRKHLNRGAARDEASARFSVDKPPPCVVEINQQFARFSAVSKRNDPRATILLGFKPAIHDKAWYETLHSPEIANGGPYMIRLCIDYDFPVN